MSDADKPGRTPDDEPAKNEGSDPVEDKSNVEPEPSDGVNTAPDEPEPQQADAELKAEAVEPRRGFVPTFIGYVTTANTVMITVYSFVLAMVIGGILIVVSDPEVRGTFSYFFSRPTDALSACWAAISEAYSGLFSGAILNFDTLNEFFAGEATISNVLAPLSETLTYSSGLILAGLAVGLAFRAGLFNIGAQGQVIMGVVGAGVVGFAFGLPLWIHLPLALLAGAAAGFLFGAVPGALKAWTGAHEVISSIMLNYIALYALGWILTSEFVRNPDKTHAISNEVRPSAQLPRLSEWEVFRGLRVNLGIIVAIVAAVGVWWLLSKSTLGYRMRAVGLNANASRTAGMSVPNTYITTMGLAGGLAGLAGAVTVLGISPYALTHHVAGEIGFDGITVALLGRAKPGGIIAAGLLFGAMRAGAGTMQSVIPLDMVTLLQALIVIFIAAPALVKAMLHLKVPAGGLATSTAKGW